MSARHTALHLALCSVVVGCTGEDSRDLTAPEWETGEHAGAIPEAQALTVFAVGNSWITKRPTLTPARYSMAAGTINGVIYLVGGFSGSGAVLANLDAYNVATNTWAPRQPLPFGRAALNGASVIAGKLYVTGGSKPNCNPPCTSFGSNSLFVYDPATNSWGKRAPLPAEATQGAQGVIRGRLYVYKGTVFGDPAFFRYNPFTDSWVTLPSPPIQHVGGVGGVIDGKFYLVGGKGGPGLFPHNVLNVYDPETRTWATKARAPTLRRDAAGGVIGGKLYVAGGFEESAGSLSTLEVYDPVADSWSTRASMSGGRLRAAATVANGKLFAIGGLADDGPTRKVEAFTP